MPIRISLKRPNNNNNNNKLIVLISLIIDVKYTAWLKKNSQCLVLNDKILKGLD